MVLECEWSISLKWAHSVLLVVYELHFHWSVEHLCSAGRSEQSYYHKVVWGLLKEYFHNESRASVRLILPASVLIASCCFLFSMWDNLQGHHILAFSKGFFYFFFFKMQYNGTWKTKQAENGEIITFERII